MMLEKHAIPCLIWLLLAILCVSVCGINILCLRNLVLLGALVYLSVIDLKSYIIPDKALLIAVLAWFGAIPFAYALYGGIAGILGAILSAVLFGGGLLIFILIMDKLLQKETMGGGDIKLLAVLGLYLGLPDALFALFFACVLGLCFALLCNTNAQKQMPFGPSIALAGWMMLLYGEQVIAWYMNIVI